MTITDVEHKASVQEREDTPLPSFNTSTLAASEMDHNMVLTVSNNLTSLAPTKCSTKYPIHAGDRVNPLFTLSMLCATYAPSSLTHPDHPEPLRHPSLIAQEEYGTHLVDKNKKLGPATTMAGVRATMAAAFASVYQIHGTTIQANTVAVVQISFTCMLS